MMNRRAFAMLSGAALALGAATVRAAAQTGAGTPKRIGVLSWWAKGVDDISPTLEPRLAEQGVVAGRDVVIEYHFAESRRERADEIARMLAASKMDVIVALATPAALAAKRATTTIPIVFHSADALRVGIVASLARPGGNLTGVSTTSTELSGKRVELLRETLPGLSRMAFLGSTEDPNGKVFAEETEAAGAKIGIDVKRHLVRGAAEFPAAFAAMSAAGVAAVVVQPLFVEHRDHIARLCVEHRLASAADQRSYAKAGLLYAYGTSRPAIHRKIADHVVKVLRGTQPAEMPVEQPTEFELVVNLGTARALGLVIPQSILIRTDEVIE